jgi:formylglycine-generating enzyme required for sulfatase activity/nitrate/TMAO reductase-like tetraheme cytochrome c subunit
MAERKIRRKPYILLISGGIVMLLFVVMFNFTINYTSSNEFCMACHVHPHAEAAWKLSNHNNTSSGFSTKCVDCHLPPEDQPVRFITRKAYHGFHDLYYYLTKDADEIDWEGKRTFEASKRFVYEDGCKKCHINLFPSTLDALGSDAHLKYILDPGASSCVQCHLDVGHYRGEVTLAVEEIAEAGREIFTEPAYVDNFEDFSEQIPGTPVSFKMVAVQGGKFNMGSPVNEPYRRPDEGPAREVELASFWMAEVEVTWNEYLAFFNATSSQGRKESEGVDEDADGITGATPPWGAPDQGWGMGTRPAITMTHHAAQTYCRWLSSVTGKKYRLPTEAEWEYAARGGTVGPYFFEGSPKDYESDRLLSKIFGADTSVISRYVIYQENSPNRTQPPALVGSNPFGLKNMLGNVAEFCLDYYDPQVYAKYPQGIVKNPRGPREGLEHVVRGGSFKNSAKDIRVARRDFTRTKDWLVTDPQIPKSIWWYSDCNHVGFRVVCEYDPEGFIDKK